MFKKLFWPITWILLAAQVGAFAATAAWDANTDGVTAGYRLLYGTVAGGPYPSVIDAGPATTVAVPPLIAGTRYYFVVQAYGATPTGGAQPVGPFSNEVAFQAPVIADPCAYPLGPKAIQIFPTKLQLTGSGGALSRARIDFQVGSPGAAVNHIAVRSNGADLSPADNADATGPGDKIGSLAGLWFTVPVAPGAYPLSILATNVAGCSREQTTPFTITVKP